MILYKVLLLALAMTSLVNGSPGTVRNKRNLAEKGHPVPSKEPLSVKRAKGENGDPDEVEIDVSILTCEKESDVCKKMKAAGGEMTKEEFAKKLADGMLGKLEGDEDKGHRDLDEWCDWYYYCDCCWCYWLYDCYYY
jgi:hypothetical protein